MMSYEEFKGYVMEHIREYLPEEYRGAEISLTETVKNNDTSLDGLQIRMPGAQAAPVLYLNSLYEDCRDGMEIGAALSGMADTYVQNMPCAEKMESLPGQLMGGYESVKDRIYCRLVNRAANEKRLEDVPYSTVEDLAVTYHIQLYSDGGGIGSVMINNNMMSSFGVDINALHEQALSNMERLSPAVIRPLGGMIMEMAVNDFVDKHGVTEETAREMLEDMEQEMDGTQMLCVTNERGVNGAAYTLLPDVMQRVSEIMGGDYYILPSSVHEILAVPASPEVSLSDLQDMVRNVNADCVAVDEVLSDHVYAYHARTQEFGLASRMQMEAGREALPSGIPSFGGENAYGQEVETRETGTRKHSAKIR